MTFPDMPSDSQINGRNEQALAPIKMQTPWYV